MNATCLEMTVYRTNYDRFEDGSGEPNAWYTAAGIRFMRFEGYTITVIDRTPADQGVWVLEPLA